MIQKALVLQSERDRYLVCFRKLQAQYSLAEMITNMSGAYIETLDKIKCSVNWMWANKSIGESRKLFNVAINEL